MSEKGQGDTSGIQTNTESENVLDDLIQNNVQFDEDEKPKTTNEANEDDDKHSDISDNETSDSSDDSKSDDDEDKDDAKSEKSKEEKEKEDHSDISEDEDENITKNQEEKKSEDLKKSDKKKSESADNSSEDEKKEKKPTLASRITRPPQQTSTTSPEVKKKKGKSYDYATKLNYLFRDARFFLVKSSVSENVDLSKVRGVWSTPPANEGRFNKAFRESRNVIMIYSVKESGRFCGFARLASESRRDGPPVPWLLPPGLSAKALGGVFKIDWICKKDLTFQKVGHLHNPWNDNKPVKIGRDGQEIEPSIAENICRLFVPDTAIDMTPILRRSKESARRQRSRPESERSQDIPNSRPLAERARPFPENRKRSFQREGQQQYEQHSRPKHSRLNPRKDYNPPPHRRQQPFELQSHHRRQQQQQQQQYHRNQAPAPPTVSRSYEEYLRSMRPGASGSGSSRPRSYQEQDQDYLGYDRRSNQQHRPSYDRSVDEFIRRNNDDKHRRYRERR